MGSPAIEEFERRFVQLPPEAQVVLFEQLARHMRQRATKEWEEGLLAMSLDPSIQEEIASIEREFQSAETDGLRDD